MEQFELVFHNLLHFEIHWEFNAIFNGNNFYMHVEHIFVCG